jgi:hypothetical protein
MKLTSLVDGTFEVQKFSGKGGWTYVLLPDVKPDRTNPFGWVQVRGTVDDYEIERYKLMPYGNGVLFLPLKAEIRKKIKKDVGDSVHVVLFLDQTPLYINEEVIACLELEGQDMVDRFHRLKEWEKKFYLDSIYSAKTEDTKARRIAKMMEELRAKNAKL